MYKRPLHTATPYPLSEGDTLQDPQWMPQTTVGIKLYNFMLLLPPAGILHVTLTFAV